MIGQRHCSYNKIVPAPSQHHNFSSFLMDIGYAFLNAYCRYLLSKLVFSIFPKKPPDGAIMATVMFSSSSESFQQCRHHAAFGFGSTLHCLTSSTCTITDGHELHPFYRCCRFGARRVHLFNLIKVYTYLRLVRQPVRIPMMLLPLTPIHRFGYVITLQLVISATTSCCLMARLFNRDQSLARLLARVHRH